MDIEEIKKKATQNNLYISRIPKKTKISFQELASEEFEGDYGFCLKFLVDFHSGLLSNPNQVFAEQIERMTQEMEVMVAEIGSLKSTKVEEPKKAIKSLSGKKIAERRE